MASIGATKREKGGRRVGYLVPKPLWLLGWIAGVGGSFSSSRLRATQRSVLRGPNPARAELVFALVLRQLRIHQHLTRAAWIPVAFVCVALAVFVSVAEPKGGHPTPDTAAWLLSARLVKGKPKA